MTDSMFNFVRIRHENGETWVASFYNGTPFPRVGETIDDTDYDPPRVLRREFLTDDLRQQIAREVREHNERFGDLDYRKEWLAFADALSPVLATPAPE